MVNTEKSSKIFQRRKATLKKKAGELGARCNSEVCLVCYEPNGGEVDVWPEDHAKAQSIIHKYYSRLESSSNNTYKKRKEKLNLSDMLEKKMKKLEEQVGNQYHHHLDNNTSINTIDDVGFPIVLPSLWDEELDNLSGDSLMGLSQCLEANIRKLDEKIELLKQTSTQSRKEEHYSDLPPSVLPHQYVSVIMPQVYASSSSHACSNILHGDIAPLHQLCNISYTL
ncbi:MADS-box transcription factor [Parasponia andersonii]|uniref:MADS-box transcription factor n=1 Tax=Parasponia andersonii TaxID=3476 RepID=A0A2P5CXP1_PARAD|nr:MADS-box transcription factor [Parasponia andersonii]